MTSTLQSMTLSSFQLVHSPSVTLHTHCVASWLVKNKVLLNCHQALLLEYMRLTHPMGWRWSFFPTGEARQRKSILECASRPEVPEQEPDERTGSWQHAIHGTWNSWTEGDWTWTGTNYFWWWFKLYYCDTVSGHTWQVITYLEVQWKMILSQVLHFRSRKKFLHFGQQTFLMIRNLSILNSWTLLFTKQIFVNLLTVWTRVKGLQSQVTVNMCHCV